MQLRFIIVSLLATLFLEVWAAPNSMPLQLRGPSEPSSHTQQSAEPCSQITDSYTGSMVTPENEVQYTKLRESHWSATAWKFPTCIVTPSSQQELQSVLSILISKNTTFAIRGAGHSPLPSWANVDGGVLILTALINDIQYDENSHTVRAGLGNTWGSLCSHLEAFGEMVVGARAPTVGLATIMGGGLSHLSNLYGFVSDNVAQFEILAGNGTLISTNSASNPELFYALKAGATNLGVVTHVTLRTYPLGKVWGGVLIYTNDYRDDIMRAFATYQQSGQLDPKSALLSYMGINNNTLYVILAYLDAVEKPSAFESFYAIPTLYDGTKMRDNFTDLMSAEIDLVVPRWTYGTTTFLLDSDTYEEVGRIAQNATSRLSTINGGSMVLMPQPISASMVSQSALRGANPMTDSLSAAAQMWFCINMGWNLESDDALIGEILMTTLGEIDTLTKSRELHHPFIFMNDAYSTQDPIRSYGTDTYQKLKRISQSTDPTRVFQRLLPGGFKLPG